MGRPCKDLQLSRSCLRDREELSAEAKSLGACEVVLRIRGLIRVSRQHTYREVAAWLGVTSGTVSNWVDNFEREGYAGLLTKPRRVLDGHPSAAPLGITKASRPSAPSRATPRRAMTLWVPSL